MSENNVLRYDFGDLGLDLVNHRLLRNGDPVPLTQKSFELLQFLIENRGRVLKKDELLDALWEGDYVEEANLTQHIYMLRKALGQKGGEHTFVETIPKTGYRFVADVREVTEEEEPDDVVTGPDDPGLQQDAFPEPYPDAGTLPFKPEEETPRTVPMKTIWAAAGLITLCVVLAAGIAYFSGAGSAVVGDGPGSIAVLPFKQISGEKDAKLGLGIADVIIAKLANIDSIAVRPTTSIIRYANEETGDLFEVGQALNVDYVIEGSIQRENGKVRVTTQLYSVAGKKQVWTETFDEEYTDIFALQDAISERVAQKVALGFKARERSFPFTQYTTDPEAYQAYSTGLAYWSQHSKVGFESAIPHFQKAIEKDPHFAHAYAYLADTYGHYGFLRDILDREKALRLGEEMANKALMLNPECAEALSAKALIFTYRQRGAEAFELMKRSLEIKPNDAHSRHRIAWMHANRGELETAIEQMKLALDIDPQSTYLNLYMASFYYLARKPEESRKYCERTLQIDPNAGEAKWRIFLAMEMEGKLDRLESQLNEVLSENGSNPGVRLLLSRVLAKKGERSKALEHFDKAAAAKSAENYPLLQAFAYVSMGDRETAIRKVEEAVRNDAVELFVLKHDPNLDPLRPDPRFSALITDIEISSGWRTAGG